MNTAILPAPPRADKRPERQSPLPGPDSRPPAPGSAEALWLQRDAEARQRHRVRGLVEALCRQLGCTEADLALLVQYLAAPLLADQCQGGPGR